MRRKSYFSKLFTIIQRLVVLLSIFLVSIFLLYWLKTYLLTHATDFFFLQSSLILVAQMLKVLTMISKLVVSTLFFICMPEIFKRLKQDSLSNLGKSIVGTLRFRRFLKQGCQAQIPTIELDEKHRIENWSTIRFNRAVNKAVLDLTEAQLTLCIPVPKEAQAQKLLKEREEAIKEHLASFYPAYLISTFERKKFRLWLIGTKRT